MSEESTEAAEPAETAQGAVETEAPSPPWGDDFDAERAWKTIQTQREREKELESDAKAWKRFREDEEFRKQAVGEFFEFADNGQDDDDDLDDEDVERPLTRAEFEEFRRQELAKESDRQFAQDLKEIVGDRKLSDHGRDLVTAKYQRGQIKNADQLRQALDDWFSYLETERRQRAKPPTPPAPPQPGRAGEAQFDRKSATPQQRRAHREARIAAALEAANQQ